MPLRRWCLPAVCLVAAACSSAPDPREVDAREQERLAAAKAGQPQAAFNDDDYFSIIPPGVTRTNAQFQVGTPRPDGYASPEMTTRLYGNVAVVTGTIGGPSGRAGERDRFVRVWAKQGETWKVVAFHGTWIGERPNEARPPLSAPLPPASDFQPKDDVERAIWTVHTGIEEASAASNAARYRELTAPEFTRVRSNGETATLDQWVSGFTGRPRARSVQSNVRLRVHGDLAVMQYLNASTSPDGAPRPHEWMTRLFVRRGTEWRLLYTQSTIAREPQPQQAVAPAGFDAAREAMNAALLAGDRQAYAALLADDFTWVDRAGRLRDKATVVKEQDAGSASRGGQAELRVYGDTVLLLGLRPGRAPNAETRYLQIWTREAGQWRMLAHHGVALGTQQVPAAEPSSPAPRSSGPAADVAAVDAVSNAINAGNRTGKSDVFAANTTAQFFAITDTGTVESRADRISGIERSTPTTQAPPASTENSTRVHGDAAVTTVLRPAVGQRPPERWTIVTVRQDGAWKRAAIIRTAVR